MVPACLCILITSARADETHTQVRCRQNEKHTPKYAAGKILELRYVF